MSSKYKIGDSQIPHFVTFTVVGWIDIFTREVYKIILLDSLKYCIINKGLYVHAWVIMSNHIHLIISSHSTPLEHLVRDIKKYTSSIIISSIIQNQTESRKDWMLNIFQFAGQNNNNNKYYQFWKQNYHPVELSNSYLLNQRLDYLHNNPVKSGIVFESWHYKYSSAIDYCTNHKGLLNIILL